MTKKTVTSFSIFALLSKEAPINGNSSWVSDDRFQLTPEQQEEEDMEYDDEYDVRFRFELEKVLNYEDKIVE